MRFSRNTIFADRHGRIILNPIIDQSMPVCLPEEPKEFVMKITSPGATPTRRGPADYFTGTVWMDPVVEAPAPARVQMVRVSFEPGARTAWHTHPLGQTLYVLSGVGLVQTEKEEPRMIRPGDVVWIAPGERHWHGASPTIGMVHLAVQEMADGSAVTWLEPVSDTQYSAVPAA